MSDFKVGDEVVLIDSDAAWSNDPEIFKIQEIEDGCMVWYVNKLNVMDYHDISAFRKLTKLDKVLK